MNQVPDAYRILPELLLTVTGILAMLAALRYPMRSIGVDVDAQPARVAADVRRIGREG